MGDGTISVAVGVMMAVLQGRALVCGRPPTRARADLVSMCAGR